MATVILQPQDCLGPGLRHQGRRRRSPTGGVKASNRQVNRGGGRCRGGETSTATAVKISPKNLVMGQVKILKRGEMLVPDREVDDVAVDCSESKGEDLGLGLGSTDRLGPDPVLLQKQIVITDLKVVDGIYAGSGAFFASPPPSSVPLPSFLDKNGSATSDLRRLLRLDLD